MPQQPAFWLQVTNQYVVENFESLLQYVRLYIYDPQRETDNSDFRRTYTHLKSVADDYAARLRSTPMYETPQFDIPVAKVMRIIAAAVLTAEKIGTTDYDLLAALINLVILNNPDLNADAETHYFHILNNCISRNKIKFLGFSWYSLEEASFMTGALEEKLAATEFFEPELPDDVRKYPCHVYENRGALIKRGNNLLLTNVNYTESKSKSLRSELSTELGLEVRTTSGSRKTSVNDLIDLYPVIGGEFDKMRPSVAPQLKTYRPTDTRMVRITRVQGIKVEAETVDPAYEVMRGNVFIDKDIINIPNEILLRVLKPGDYLAVKGGGTTGLTFRLDWAWIGDVLEEFAENMRDDEEELECMFVREFGKGGTRWISEEGVLVNLFDTYNSDADRRDIARAREENLTCLFRVHDYKRDNDKCIINGRFAGIASDEPVDPDAFLLDAQYQFVENLIDDAVSSNPQGRSDDKPGAISPYLVRLLGILCYRLGLKLNRGDTYARMEYLITAMLMLRMGGTDNDAEYVRAQLDYQKALAGFAQGRTPFELALPDHSTLPEVPELQRNARMVDILHNYHEATDAAAIGDTILTASDATDVIEKLVEASNSLIGRIDESELNRIKKTICSHLDVTDEYRDIYTSGTNYGVESEFLEFKASCVEPPAQWRTTSLDRNIELQKWNILKAVCAFLNSMSGGELLIGVSDAGFALGLGADIQTLYTTHRIAEPNIDRLRMYVKLFTDTAFTTSDGRVSGTAITAGRVEIKIETSDQNRDILRVKVSPYPWDVVKINLPDRPARFNDTYVRTSGASTPLDTSGIRETKLRKIKALDRDDYKTATILQAIDEKQVLEIANYTGHRGADRRRLEPFKLLSDFNAFLAYDLDRRDMRMFKLSRFKDTDIKLTRDKWRNEQHHADREVDIFGMVQKAGSEGTPVTLWLSDYGRSLLTDECALAADVADTMIVANKNIKGRDNYPWMIHLTVYSYAGVARFVMGLPGHVKVVESPELDAYIAEARAAE